ncbi:MAG: L-aspartate oxidase, partial [Verrucomicrobiae bacterium]|nr:L-aspartate oxidase [Verrucomicrobiae bacterium]
ACTGLHGANRLASNSLLEAIVCAHRAAQHILANPMPKWTGKVPPWRSDGVRNPEEFVLISHLWDEIRRMMWDYVGIVRTNRRLQRA